MVDKGISFLVTVVVAIVLIAALRPKAETANVIKATNGVFQGLEREATA